MSENKIDELEKVKHVFTSGIFDLFYFVGMFLWNIEIVTLKFNIIFNENNFLKVQDFYKLKEIKDLSKTMFLGE